LADNDIKQRIVLTGEKEYSAALKEAKRNLNVLRSELKAETAELGKNATAQQQNEVKLKNLQKQIKEQEKVVKTYEKALEEVRAKYGDNEEAVAKWEIKLNDARTALANMKSSLNDVGQGMKAVQDSANMGVVAANSLADSLGKVASVGDTISSAIESSMSSVFSSIKDTIAMVWESVVDLAARSNNLVDMAGFWNTSATNIQKWGKAAAAASGTLTDMNDLVTKIVAKSNSDTKNGGILAGVSPENYEDQWEFAMSVMDSLSQLEGKERIAAATDIFGKNFTKALDFVNDWDKIKAALNENDVEQGGYGLTEEQINQMSDLYDQVNRLKESWQSLKDMATVSLFGDLAVNVTGNIQAVLDAFRDYFNAEDEDAKAEALGRVKENIIEAFKAVSAAIQDGIAMLSGLAEEMKNSDDELVRAFGNALDGLVKALEWLADGGNWEVIKQGIEWLIGIWAAGKITSAIGNLTAFGANLGTIFKFFGGGSGGTPTVTPTDTGVPAAASPKGKSWFGTDGYTLFDKAVQGGGTKVVLDEAEALMNQAEENIETLEKLTAENGWNDAQRGFWMLTGQNPEGNPLYEGWEKAYNEESAEQTAEQILEKLAGGDRDKLYEDIERYAPDFDNDNINGWTPWGMLKRYWGEGEPLNQSDVEGLAAYLQQIEEARLADEADDPILTLVDTMNTLNNTITEDLDTGFVEEDLPADWWDKFGPDNGLSGEDLQGFRSLPGAMSSAVARGVSGIKVTLDGQTVGNLVAPYVSEQIALSIYP